MSNLPDNTRFSAMEYCLQSYFQTVVSPLMKSVKDELSEKQVDELKAHQSSLAGILASAHPYLPDLSFQQARITGQWTSKTAEDYLDMCREKINQNISLQKDLTVMAGEWRSAAIAQIGRERYDSLSAQIGTDLATAYVGERMENLMIEKLIHEQMPKSTADYILQRAAKQSIWNLPNQMMQSPLEAEIEARSEKAYRPSNSEKTAGNLIASVTDAATMGGAGSWKALATFVGSDLLVNGLFSQQTTCSLEEKKALMERGISQGVFGSKENVFSHLRQHRFPLDKQEETWVMKVNQQLSRSIYAPHFMNVISSWNKNSMPNFTPTFEWIAKKDSKYNNVPLVIAPGQEEAYLKGTTSPKAKDSKAVASTPAANEPTEIPVEEQISPSSPTAQTNGWDGLMKSVGLDGFGSILGNLGYVLAMLPDMLVGIFTGKTQSLTTNNTLLPVASILAGMFTRNPLLKMLLVGMGGANLINKAGQESLTRKEQEGRDWATPQFRVYEEEPLNPRIEHPVLQGNNLIATLDRIPCCIQLPSSVIQAYHQGALPLNTLANAVLDRYDQSNRLAAANYENSQSQETGLSRGIQ